MAETRTESQQQSGTVSLESSDFASLLQKEFRPPSDKAKEAVENAVRTLAEQALVGTNLVSGDVLATIEGLIAQLDAKLTEQINLIMHAPEFQALEGAWRGLHYLVNNTETDTSLKIRVMNISKNDLSKTLKKFKGTAWDQSPIFKKMYEEEFGQFGGEPFGTIVADYYFDNSAPDVELLSNMAKIAAAAHAPFIAAANPTVMLMDSWGELANPRDLSKIFQTPEHAAWRSFRESEDARYVGLAMPRFLARQPYGERLILSKNSTLRKILPRPIVRGILGQMRPMQWLSILIARLKNTVGVREFEVSNPVVRSRVCLFTHFPLTTVV